LIEHFAGAFPVWLAPEQVRVIPITDEQGDAAQRLRERFRSAGIRASVDDRSETLNYRIRDAEMMKVPFMAVVGKREVEQGTVAIRARGAGKKQEVMSVDEFEGRVRRLIASRGLGLE
jgi:threonyl-tRNA synthetase